MSERPNKIRIKSSLGWLNGKEVIGGKPKFIWTNDESNCWKMHRENAEHQLTLVALQHPDAEIVG